MSPLWAWPYGRDRCGRGNSSLCSLGPCPQGHAHKATPTKTSSLCLEPRRPILDRSIAIQTCHERHRFLKFANSLYMYIFKVFYVTYSCPRSKRLKKPIYYTHSIWTFLYKGGTRSQYSISIGGYLDRIAACGPVNPGSNLCSGNCLFCLKLKTKFL